MAVTAFHAVDRGSNPLGDAITNLKEDQGVLEHLGLLLFSANSLALVSSDVH